MPSLSNSPWVRGAPQSGLARLMSRINLRMSADSFGRPPGDRLPSPVKAKTRAVPADYSFGLNHRPGAQHVRSQTIQSGEYQPIELAECRPLRRFTSQDVQLMAQHQDLCLQRDPRLEKPRPAHTRSVCRTRLSTVRRRCSTLGPRKSKASGCMWPNAFTEPVSALIRTSLGLPQNGN